MISQSPRIAPRRGVAGLVLAAGAGVRFGGPKALARTPDGTPWVELAVDVLRAAECGPVLVALGADAELAERLLPAAARPLHVVDWRRGISVAIAAGVATARREGADALVIVPVDTPDASAAAVARIVGAAGARPRDALVQATYDGTPGHPVLIGAEHFAPLEKALAGDRGARPYLVAHGVTEIECSDLWSGADVDEPTAD